MEDCKRDRDQFEKEEDDRLSLEKERLAAAIAAQQDEGRPGADTAYARKLTQETTKRQTNWLACVPGQLRMHRFSVACRSPYLLLSRASDVVGVFRGIHCTCSFVTLAREGRARGSKGSPGGDQRKG